MTEFDKIIGYRNIKNEVIRIIDVIKNPKKYKRLGVEPLRGIMFVGDPGIGKTTLAKAALEACGRNSYIIRKNKPNGEFVNYIKEVFAKAAENEPSVILLDDLDKFANEDQYHRNAEEYVTVQACIDDMKDKQVFVIATVNNIHDLPYSLKRSGRFDKIFHMNFPKGNDAREILEYYLKSKKVAENIDVEEVTRFMEGESCAQLEAVINEAGIYAGYKGKLLIEQEDLKRACLSIIFQAPEDGGDSDDQEIRMGAIHEAGHAVIAELLKPGTVNFVTIASHTDSIGGITNIHLDRNIETMKEIENNIMISLAGKAATEIVLGQVDIGATRDLHQAYESTVSLIDDHAAYGFHCWIEDDHTPAHVEENRDIAMQTEVSRYYIKTKQLLIENREFYDRIVTELMEKKTLSYKDIDRIKKCV